MPTFVITFLAIFAIALVVLAAIAASDEEQRKKDALFNRQLEEFRRNMKWEGRNDYRPLPTLRRAERHLRAASSPKADSVAL